VSSDRVSVTGTSGRLGRDRAGRDTSVYLATRRLLATGDNAPRDLLLIGARRVTVPDDGCTRPAPLLRATRAPGSSVSVATSLGPSVYSRSCSVRRLRLMHL